VFYAAQYWTTHVVSSSSTTDSGGLLDALNRFCDEHIFHWRELLSLIQSLAYNTQSNLLALIGWLQVNQRFAGDSRMSKIRDLLRDGVRVLQAYAEPIRSRALHTFHSAFVTMPHCPLLNTLAQPRMPEVRHTCQSSSCALGLLWTCSPSRTTCHGCRLCTQPTSDRRGHDHWFSASVEHSRL
jgi:hypothetical protein